MLNSACIRRASAFLASTPPLGIRGLAIVLLGYFGFCAAALVVQFALSGPPASGQHPWYACHGALLGIFAMLMSHRDPPLQARTRLAVRLFAYVVVLAPVAGALGHWIKPVMV